MRSLRRLLNVVIFMLCALMSTHAQQSANSEWKAAEDALGRKGSIQPGDVYKFSMPRSDLKVTLAGTPIKAGLALGSWLAFKKMGKDAIVMGDLVLTESEVEPVMAKLQQEGVEQTAIHNHLLNESPRVMYMHVAGHGDAVKLASALKNALALTKTPSASPTAPAQQQNLGFGTAQLDQALGYQGKNNNGIYQFAIARAETINDMGTEVPPSMGTATSINFQPTGGGKAAITGDFVLIGTEVNPVIRALRDNGIQVTAVHSHMLTEEPRLFFMHFWANDDAVKLAKGLRAAIDKTNSAKPKQ
jgi:biotin operon repressor